MTDRKEIVRAFGEAWARRDLEAVMTFFSEDCVYAASVGPEPGTTYRGRDAVRAGIESMFQYDGGSAVEAGRIFAEGERVFSEWTYYYPNNGNQRPARGCDVFEFVGDKIRMKDAFRKQATALTSPCWVQGKGASELYHPRRFESRDTWVFGGKRFKVIEISWHLEQRPFEAAPATIEAAYSFVGTLVQEVEKQGGHFDLGFVILHQGKDANWLLFDWWIEGGIICQVLCRSTLERPTLFERVSRPFMACVWEMVAVAHERDAWVATMMRESPDPEDYLRRRIAPGQH